MVILILTVGPRRALSTMKTYPAIVLTSCFSFFTVGPVATASSCSAHFNGERRKIRISFFHTWINVIITFAFMFIMPSASSMDIDSYDANGNGRNEINIANYEFLLRLISLTSVPILLLGGVLPLILIQLLDKCQSCCCNSCLTNNCLPIKNLAILDVDNMDQIQNVEDFHYQEQLELMNLEQQIETPQNMSDSVPVTLLSHREMPFDQ